MTSDDAGTILRGRLLDFRRPPENIRDTDAYGYEEDGAVLLRDGRIAACGPYSEVAASVGPSSAGEKVTTIDHRPHLILPGLIDAHCHFPQMQVIASWGDKLLDWLADYTFPEEAKFADPAHAARIAGCFLDALARHGTTTAAIYATVHKASAEALFREAEARDVAVVAGRVMMDRNAPDDLRDTARSGYDDCKDLIERWHGRGRLRYAVTPRFAITSTPEQLEAAGTLLKEHPDCYLQTHLSENHAEIAETAELYPEALDYLDIYDRYGLVGPRSLMGHCLHLSARERTVMADRGAVAVFCPTSNLFLGSGLFDAGGMAADGIRTAVASDVGGGTSYSMLRTLDEGYKVLQMRNWNLDPLMSFYWATLGNARALMLEEEIGTLQLGSAADIAILDSRATPAMALRMETVESLAEELFVLQTLGDDRAVVETYIAGRASKPA